MQWPLIWELESMTQAILIADFVRIQTLTCEQLNTQLRKDLIDLCSARGLDEHVFQSSLVNDYVDREIHCIYEFLRKRGRPDSANSRAKDLGLMPNHRLQECLKSSEQFRMHVGAGGYGGDK